MNIEEARNKIRLDGVRFPRIGLDTPSIDQSSQEGNHRILTRADTAQITWEDKYSHFMSEEGLYAERADLTPRAATAIQLLVEVAEELSPATRKRWERALNNFSRAVVAGHSAISKILSWDLDDSMTSNILENSLRIGARIELVDALNRIGNLIPDAKFVPETAGLVRDAIELAGFSDLGPVVTPVKDIAIADVMDDKNWQNLGLQRILDWVMSANLARRRVDLNLIFPEDYPPAQAYPQTSMDYLHDASFAVNNAFSLNSIGVNRFRKIPELAIAQRGMERFANRFTEIQKAFYSQLFKPDSEGFAGLRDIVNKYLNGPKDEIITVLFSLGLQEQDSVIDAYRKSKDLVKSGNNCAFFQLFGESIKEIIEEGRLADAFYIPTQDDLAGILDEEHLHFQDSGHVAYESLAAQISRIFKKKSTTEYEFDIETVDWGNLIPPQRAAIKFNPKPHSFSVELIWKNEVGEALNVTLSFNTKGNKFNWNFIESPEEPSMAGMRKASFVIAQNLLQSLDLNISTELEKKRIAELGIQVASSPRGPKKERSEDEIYSLRKIAKEEAKSKKPTTVHTIQLEAPSEVKKVIKIPETVKLNSMLAVLGFVDQNIVRDALNEFNEKGIGRLTRKKSRDEDGKPLYTLAIGCTTPKGVRVLVKESSNGSGIRIFEIIDIRYRKDIYRKARI